MMMENFTPDKEVERYILLYDQDINTMLKNIIAMVESRSYWIDTN